MLRILSRQDARIRRKGDRLSHAEQQAHRIDHYERVHEACHGSGARPYEEADGEYDADVETVDEPARNHKELEGRVRKEKCGQQRAEANSGKVQLTLNVDGADREGGAVHIIQKTRNEQKGQNAPLQAS